MGDRVCRLCCVLLVGWGLGPLWRLFKIVLLSSEVQARLLSSAVW